MSTALLTVAEAETLSMTLMEEEVREVLE